MAHERNLAGKVVVITGASSGFGRGAALEFARAGAGGDGVLKVMMTNLMPHASEKAAAKTMHKTQYEKAPPGASSSNALHEPTAKGEEVDTGRRKRK